MIHDFTGFADMARASFAILELWGIATKVRSVSCPEILTVPVHLYIIIVLIIRLVKTMVSQDCGTRSLLLWAVHKSAEVARNGCSFAMDARILQRLFRGKDSLRGLGVWTENIKDVAHSAHQDAEEMH